MRLHGLEAVLPPERVSLPADASGDWIAAGTGWGSYAARMPVKPLAAPQVLLPQESTVPSARVATV